MMSNLNNMQDENNQSSDSNGTTEDNSQGTNQEDNKSQSEDSGTQNAEQNNESGESQKSASQSEEGDKSSEKSEDEKSEDNDGDIEPPTRKTKLDYILERKNKQIEKLKQEQAKATQGQQDNQEKNSEGEEEDISPEEEAKIVKVLEKRYGKTFETVDAMANNTHETELKNDVKSFLETEEGKHFKSFEAKILKYAQHPNRANIPINAIAYEVAGPQLLKIGAKMAEEARKEALKTQAGGGGNNRSSESGALPDFAKMSNAEFEAYKNNIKFQERD